MAKNNAPKYKYTKQILKLAKQDGMTHKEIAKKAGIKETSVSQVDKWLNGTALASQRQMQFFINKYGSALKRKIEHLFYTDIHRLEINESLISILKKLKISQEVSINNKNTEADNSSTVYDLANLNDEQKDYLLGKILPNNLSQDLFEKIYSPYDHEEIHQFIYKLQFRPLFFKLNGEIVFKHTSSHHYQASAHKIIKTAATRIILLRTDNKFHIIIQRRIPKKQGEFIHSPNEDSMWDSSITKDLNIHTALKSIDDYATSLRIEYKGQLSDNAITIPFIARQALLKQGIAVPDVIDLTSDSEIIKESPKG